MNLRNLILAAFASIIAAQAHPGHDMMAHGGAHVLTSAYHLFVLCAVGVISFAVGQVVRNGAARGVFRVAGAAALGVVAVVWTLGL
jgi:hypothetical protein